MTDLTLKHPPGTLIALPAELVNGLTQYLSHCSESAHNEPEDPAHALVKAVDAAYSSSITPGCTETFMANTPTFLDVAYFAATVAEEAVIASDLGMFSSPAAITTSVLAALFDEGHMLSQVKDSLLPRIANGDYDGIHWENYGQSIALVVPGSGRAVAGNPTSPLRCPEATDFSWIPEPDMETPT